MIKFFNNYNLKAIKTISLKYYLIYLFYSLIYFFKIIKTKKLYNVDVLMGKTNIKKFYLNKKFFFYDGNLTDKNITEDPNFSFGLIREIYIRNCYLKHIPFSELKKIENTVDLGSNRGVFSCLATTFSKKIIGVEIDQRHESGYKKNLQLNNFSNFYFENKKIVHDDEININNVKQCIGINSLLKKYEIKKNCFIKMDIEGGEISLFKNTDWLEYINILVMEVHPQFGVAVSEILEKLKEKNFNLITTNEDLLQTVDNNSIEFIYALKKSKKYN